MEGAQGNGCKTQTEGQTIAVMLRGGLEILEKVTELVHKQRL